MQVVMKYRYTKLFFLKIKRGFFAIWFIRRTTSTQNYF